MDYEQLKHQIRESDPFPIAQHKNPYKFLDYYNPEDADIFFGRDLEIRQLEQKFYNSRLLVLHGESGTGKTSLIRAGLIPRLSPEEHVPVYVRVLQEPLLAIQRELMHQLRLEEDCSPESKELSDLETSLAPGTLHQRIKDFLGALPNLADSPAQRALIASAGLDQPLEQQIQFGLPPGQFVELLVSMLSKYGTLADGRQALAAILEAAQQYVGQDRKLYCETLLHALRRQPQPFIPSQPAAAHQFTNSLAEFLFHITTRMGKTVVIVLDQFEEFFLRFPEDVRRPFEAELGGCFVTSGLNIKVLMALRTDYFGALAEFEDAIPQIFTHQLYLTHLTEAQAGAAVIKPPQRLGMQIDEDMVQNRLLPELLNKEGGIESPLLQIVCNALYQNAQNEARSAIGMADYEAIGDVNGALSTYLNQKMRQFGQYQPQARAVLKALVTTEGTKQAVFLPELSARLSSAGVRLSDEELQRRYLDKFVHYRLVRVEEVEGRPRYELSHDYLAKQIEAWIAEGEREMTKVLELIDRAYETYRATNMLLERSALQMIKPFEEQLVLPPDKQTFVDRSKTQVRNQRRNLWLKVAAALMFVALVVGGILGYQTYQQYQETIRQRDIAITRQQEAEEQRKLSRQQTEIAIELAKKNLRKSELSEIEELNLTSEILFISHDELAALLIGVKAGINVKYKDIPIKLKNQTIVNLRNILDSIHVKNRLEGHESRVWSVDFSPDGTLLASGSWDSTIKLWDITNGRNVKTLHGHSDRVWGVAFSPDSSLLASGSSDKTIKLWNVANGKQIKTFQGHSAAVESVMFSPDGMLLASGSYDKSVGLWQVADGKRIRTLHGHSDPVGSVVFSPDGTILASGGGNEIKLWRAADGKEMRTLHSSDLVTSATFNSDGTVLASGSGDDTIKLWNVDNGRELATLYGHFGAVMSVAFNSDGTVLASGSGDNTIRLWNVIDGRELAILPHSDFVLSVDFSPDGTLLASGNLDNSIKFWSTIENKENPKFYKNSGRGKVVTLSLSGEVLTSGNDDEAIKLKNMNWDLDDLLVRGCEWLHGYLKNNPNVSAADRAVCDEVLQNDME